MIRIKICGLSTPDTLDAALDAGADMVGFVFFAPSPRNVSLDGARDLAARVEGRAQKVALTVDADDATLDAIVDGARAGHAAASRRRDAGARRGHPRARSACRVMKAIGVAAAADIARAAAYDGVADTILFDAKPPRGAVLPGGNGRAFDWTILRTVNPGHRWMLSGGLDAGNVAEALRNHRRGRRRCLVRRRERAGGQGCARASAISSRRSAGFRRVPDRAKYAPVLFPRAGAGQPWIDR